MSSSAIGKEVRLVGKHSAVYVVGQVLSRGVGFFMIPVYTSCIAPANYGAMDLIAIITGIVAITISMGVADAMARFYYAEKDESARRVIVSTILIGFAALGLPVVLLFIVAAGPLARLVLEGAEYRLYLQLGIAAVWFGMLCEIGRTYLRMRYMAGLFVALTILQLAMALSLNIYFVVVLHWDILGIFLSTLITQGVIAVLVSTAILAKVGFLVSPALLRRLVAFGLPLVPLRIGQMLGFASNRLFLRWFGAADPAVALAQVGIFSLGAKFAVIVNRFVTVPFNSFWGPRRLELVARDDPGARETVARICTYATFASTFAVLLLCAGIESVIEIIADPRYHGAHVVVPFIALGYVGLGLEPHFTTGILHRGRTSLLSGISLVSLAVALLWNWLLVPRYGLLGAATSNLAAMTVRETLIYLVARRVYPIPFELRRLALMLVTAAMVYLGCQTVSFPSPYATLLARTAIAALFPIALGCMGFYHGEEIRFIGQLLQRGRTTVVEALSGR